MSRLGRTLRPVLMTLLLTAWLPSGAAAIPIAFDFIAETSYVYDPGGHLGGTVHVGSIVQGRYRYESTTIDTNPLPTVGDYWHDTPPFGVSLEVGGLHFRTDPADVAFLMELGDNHYGQDHYLFHSYHNLFDVSVLPDPSSYVDNMISWQLNDPTGTAISSTKLPLFPPNLADWESWSGLTISSDNFSDNFFVRAHVASVQLVPESPVPEPATGALLLTGLLSAGTLVRASRRR
jgi:hypothetical protein